MIWIAPRWYRELDEFMRIPEQLKIWPWHLIWMYMRGTMVELDDETWEKLSTTDSWRATDMAEVEYICNETSEIDWCIYEISPALKAAFVEGSSKKVFAPIMIRRKDGTMYLISGNRRLMMARACGIRPRCFLLNE